MNPIRQKILKAFQEAAKKPGTEINTIIAEVIYDVMFDDDITVDSLKEFIEYENILTDKVIEKLMFLIRQVLGLVKDNVYDSGLPDIIVEYRNAMVIKFMEKGYSQEEAIQLTCK